MSRPRVVVVGAGFGGLWAARALAREAKGADVLLLVFSKRAGGWCSPTGSPRSS